MPSRSELRDHLFAKKHNFRHKMVDFLGADVEVRQPSVGGILDTSDADDADSKTTFVDALIKFCYVPGTDEKVFEKDDVDKIMELPPGEWVSGFNTALSELLEINVEEAEGN